MVTPRDHLLRLPDEVHALLRDYLDGLSAFYLSRLSGTLHRLYTSSSGGRKAVRLRPWKETRDHALDRLVAGQIEGLGVYGGMEDVLGISVDFTLLRWISITRPTLSCVGWVLDMCDWMKHTLHTIELRHLDHEYHAELLLDRHGRHLQRLVVLDTPKLNLDWFGGKHLFALRHLVLDGRLDSPRQTLADVLRACPDLTSLTLTHCTTPLLDALGCAIEERLCQHLVELHLEADAPPHRATALYLMQTLARHHPPHLRLIRLKHLKWCLYWPNHLATVVGATYRTKRRRDA